jgi:hypothetical protein
MFGSAFKHTSRFFGTHFTQMKPQTAMRLLSSNHISRSLSSMSLSMSNLDIIPMAVQGLQVSPVLGETGLSAPKEDPLKEAQKSLLESEYLELKSILNKPLLGSVSNTRLIDELSMEQIVISTTWLKTPQN